MITITISAKVFWFLIILVLATSGLSIYNAKMARKLEKSNVELIALNQESRALMFEFIIQVNRKLDEVNK
jgi:Na+-transporting methylmalonyl-CoA/oxaloacetate decarboxylase gamma subunit